VQVKPDVGTEPLDVGGLNVQFTVSTTVSNVPFASWSWLTVIVADVNDTSVILSIQLEFGQPGDPGTGDVGAAVVVEMVTFPFLMSLASTGVDPTSVTGAGFWPGASFDPDGVVHVETVPPVAVRVCSVSKFPSPA
jgi:hypothetical protein